MNDFEIGFQHQMNKLDLKRKDVAEALGVTMPTPKEQAAESRETHTQGRAHFRGTQV